MEYPFKDLQPLDEATARTGYYRDWSHIDADTFHQISELAQFIREKGYGADTREAIAQALERVYYDATQSDNASMEVSLARKHFEDLASRLDASDDILTSAATQLAQKVDKGNVSVSDINKNLGKLDQTYMSDEFLQQMVGNTPINSTPADESVTTEKIAPRAVTRDKVGFRFMTGTIKQGTINIDTVNNKLIASGPAGVFIDSVPTYLLYQAHEITIPSGLIIVIYFNIVTKQYEVYSPGSTIQNHRDLAYIATYWNGKFNSTQDYDSMLVNGVKASTPYVVKYETMSTPHLYAYAVNGDINIDTTTGTMTYNGFNMLWGGRQAIIGAGTADFSSIPASTAINIYFDAVSKSFVFYSHTDSAQFNKNLMLFGTIYGGKLHNSFSNKFVKVNGVKDGGWYVEPENGLSVDTNERIFTLNEVWNHFESGEKFPIAFLSDSTTDGNTTTNDTTNVLGTDHINENAYPYILQQHIRQETGNNIARVYNAGFSGRTASWAKTNIEQIFGSGTPYEDVKMVGIGYGINDSLQDDIKIYYDTFKSNVEWLINYFKNKGVQPFLVTTQATLVKNGSKEQTRTHRMNTVANEIKKELANKYNLEYIDTNKYTEMFLLYSKEDINAISPDSLHFGDVGHRYEGEFYFSEISPRVIKSSNVDRISMLTQNIKTDLNDTQFTRSDLSTYKYIVSFEREIASDLLILDVLLFNDEKTQLKLNVVGDVVIKINGVEVDVETFELDLGLHKIEVISKSGSVYFEGIEIVRI